MATATAVERLEANVPAADLNGPHVANSVDVVEKYAQEREKRIGKGLSQFVDLRESAKFKSLLDDPWVEPGTPINEVVSDGGHCRVLIVGAGYGGILFAVNLIKAGFNVYDIVIVDPGGGFGGTWYWNHVEAYIYMPLLEEMQYMPKHKYAGGEELREYAESICRKYNLFDRAMFQSSAKKMSWDDDKQEWKIVISQTPKGLQPKVIDVSADFVILASGVLDNAKLPDAAGIEEFQGDMFHTARWHYNVTGGGPTDPRMTRLRDKKVGIIGTGATAIQVVPRLAECSKELYVFQRTPSAVAARNNRTTDPFDWTTEIANKPGWQRERNLNYFAFVGNAEPKPAVDLVKDGWTSMPSFSALIAGPSYNVTPENAAEHVSKMYALDRPIQDRVRKRALDAVDDPQTASKLQAWYAGWCKRPCFHDEYLPAFNHPHVRLVDTDGKGIDRLSRNGVIASGHEYELDVIVWASGFVSPAVGTPASKASIDLTGRRGERLEEKVREKGVSSLHGVVSRGFPNMFWPGPFQTAASPNQMFLLETLSSHVAYIVAEASCRTGGKAVVEPTAEAEEQWAARILEGAAVFSSVAGCTPSYINKEGEVDNMTMEEKIKAAKGGVWAKGIVDYVHALEAWRKENTLHGLEIKSG
ncbi:hypothetical protein M409DRAFT_51889 [Zasmidium cellare ATCC 36951]|uniref:Uncharacterized protein n=1 Tax=Zasmidium cellare ATCC 36951 TaxID=1080233 RepID=A0A6A6CSR2_ZASCE|nr:uncharacterized protein M409DRAFT_51889 [Zasmidium cellare ATCC 36951]KAF2170131.1 hypothetical protein M409DRAFT_51889 [Zasmidium cellare ATCC 36951]